ncbi:MAG: thioredoxin family protein [Desulfosporosinus sp.]|nr:thioredoxin family protein [Desulfosporosinus sp.]
MMKKLWVLLAVLVVAFGVGAYFWYVQPVQLNAKAVTPQELKQMITQDDNFFVYFHSPICPKCVKAEPLIAKAVQLTKVRMVALDVQAYPDTKTELLVPGTPTIFYYKNHKLAKGITGVLATYQEYVSLFRDAAGTK